MYPASQTESLPTRGDKDLPARLMTCLAQTRLRDQRSTRTNVYITLPIQRQGLRLCHQIVELTRPCIMTTDLPLSGLVDVIRSS